MSGRTAKAVSRTARAFVAALIAFAVAAAPSAAQAISHGDRTFNEQVLRPDGQPVIPLFDGWFANEDGSRSLCFGYFNLNTEETLDIAVGPDNRIEPVLYDGGQPTHFDENPAAGYRRHFCVFTVEVPEDFGSRRVRWSLSLDGETYTVPGHTDPPYVLDEPVSDGRGKVAPTLRLSPDGPEMVGRRADPERPSASIRTRVDEVVPLTARVLHPAEEVWVGWSLHRGPGSVTFSEAEQWAGVGSADPDEWSAVTTHARFAEPGDYLIRVQTIDDPVESFEYHCCWTNGYIHVLVE